MHPTEHIVFYRDLTAEQEQALQGMLASDPAARHQFERWCALHAWIARKLDEGIVDRAVFGLFVLVENGRQDLLSADEHDRVAALAPVIRAALRRHDGLAAVARDLRADADAFEQMWDERFAPGPDRNGTKTPRIDRHPDRRDRPASRRHAGVGPWLVRAGIGAALVVFVALLVVVGRRDFSSVTITTADGEVRFVELGDGSGVRMLGESRLTYVPPAYASALDRRVEFEGSAFFEIASAEQGFVVRTPNAQAVVLGTSFGVRADGDETEIVLAEGRLSLASRSVPEHVVVLSPGQMSRVETAQAPMPPEDVRVHERLAWTGLFVFRAAPLHEILTQLGRFHQIDVSADEALIGERVTGRFDQGQDLLEILDVVATAVDAQVRRTVDGGYRLAAP